MRCGTASSGKIQASRIHAESFEENAMNPAANAASKFVEEDQAQHLAYVKTDAGNHELKSRTLKLPQRMRTMLIMIDGMTPVAQLHGAAARLGVEHDYLRLLQGHGLIAPVADQRVRSSSTVRVDAAAANDSTALSEADRFTAAKRFMNDTVVDAIGLRAFFFTLKIEKCGTRADLAALLPDYTKAVNKGNGEDIGRVLSAEAQRKLQ
jgi:hypothetical protein